MKRYKQQFVEGKEKKYMKYEGMPISYKGLNAEIENVFSYGIEILVNGSSELLTFKDFDMLVKEGIIEF